MGYSALSFWPRMTTNLGWASAARGAGAAVGGAGAAGSTGGAAATSGSTGAAGGGATGVASTTAATTAASAMGWAMGMVSSRTWATGTGGAAGAGSTPLKSDLHCSQNSAPSSLSKLQNGHFSMIGLTSGLKLASGEW